MAIGRDKQRVTITLSKADLRKVERFQKQHKLKSSSAAARALIGKGLTIEEDDREKRHAQIRGLFRKIQNAKSDKEAEKLMPELMELSFGPQRRGIAED